MKEIICSGPLYRGMEIENNKIRIYFDFEEDALVDQQIPVTDFVIAGADSIFVPAHAVIDGNSVVVYSDEVPNPVAVRFAWKNFAHDGLDSSAELPV